MELCEVPLGTRCQAAVAVIWLEPALGKRGRRDLLAAALWPSHARTPNSQPIAPAEPTAADRRSLQPSIRGPFPPAPHPSTLEQRDEARAAFRGGATITALAERYEQPWPVMRKWVRGRG